MNNESILSDLNDNDVISFSSPSTPAEVYKISRIRNAFSQVLKTQDLGAILNQKLTSLRVVTNPGEHINGAWKPRPEYWFNDGVPCELLKSDVPGWTQGKIKVELVVKFIPDAVESLEETESQVSPVEYPLDDIRRSMNTQN